MPSLKTAILRLCTLAIPWPTSAAASLGCAEVAGARIYLAALAKDGVVERAGDDLWRAGDTAAIHRLRVKKTQAHHGGNSAAYRRSRQVWDDLERADIDARRSGAVLTSQDRAQASRVCRNEQTAPEDDMTTTLEPMVSPAAAAATLGVSTWTVVRAIKRGSVKGARKVGRQWRIPVTSVMDIGSK